MADKRHGDGLANLAHLDHLGHVARHNGQLLRFVYLYSEAPGYRCLGDPDEGIGCVDDAARAAVVYLRHVELCGDMASREKAEALLRFVMYMQADNGLFYNFVLDEALTINRDHHRSTSQTLDWWAARAIWALGMGVRVLSERDRTLATQCAKAIEKALPHVLYLLNRYPQTENYRGRTIPTWLVGGDAADATSELVLGLAAYSRVKPSLLIQTSITRLIEGMALMRYGSMNTYPYGAHASNRDTWHKWGNSQTQAMAEAGILLSATMEADHFYPRLLVEGFLHSITFDDLHALQYYERIAYGIRGVSVGLLRLAEQTGDERYSIMAGLAATWFTGNNDVGAPMYDAETGRGYDGILGEGIINRNSGAESTIEAVCTMLEIEQDAVARTWLSASAEPATRKRLDNTDYLYRVFSVGTGAGRKRLAMRMNLTHETFDLIGGNELAGFVAAPGVG